MLSDCFPGCFFHTFPQLLPKDISIDPLLWLFRSQYTRCRSCSLLEHTSGTKSSSFLSPSFSLSLSLSDNAQWLQKHIELRIWSIICHPRLCRWHLQQLPLLLMIVIDFVLSFEPFLPLSSFPAHLPCSWKNSIGHNWSLSLRMNICSRGYDICTCIYATAFMVNLLSLFNPNDPSHLKRFLLYLRNEVGRWTTHLSNQMQFHFLTTQYLTGWEQSFKHKIQN